MSESDHRLAAEIAEEIVNRQTPHGWQRFAALATPIIGVIWTVLAAVAVPWVTWVTVSLIQLEPGTKRYSQQDALLSHSILREEMRAEIQKALSSIDQRLDEQNQKLTDIITTLARKGLDQ